MIGAVATIYKNRIVCPMRRLALLCRIVVAARVLLQLQDAQR
jgi:hypothetical protein